jgi:molecular chaperone GrpE
MSDGHTSEQEEAAEFDVDVSEHPEGAAAAAPSGDSAAAGSDQDTGAGDLLEDDELTGELVDEELEPEQAQAPVLTDADRAREYLALAQRTQADFENFRKRAARDAKLAQERGIAKLARELLPAIDNLERAIQAAEAANDPLIDGVRLVQTEMLKALSRVGIEPFSPAGEVFDPQHHEAVAQAPIPGAQSGTVVEVYQQGFRQGETVLRPARVLVAA